MRWELTQDKGSEVACVVCACPYMPIRLPRPLTQWLELRTHETDSEAANSQWKVYLGWEMPRCSNLTTESAKHRRY